MQKHPAFLLALLITILIAMNISIIKILSTDNNLETIKITRIVDGDTLELEDGRKVRLANINTPEKNFPNYNLSIEYIQQFINSTANLEILGAEKYGRILGRVYTTNGNYLNLELVKQGFASKFLVEDDELTLFSKAEEQAINQEKGIWKKSEYFNCLKSEIDAKDEIVTIINQCDKLNIASWLLKDESRKYLRFTNTEINDKLIIHTNEGENNETDIFWNAKTNIWNNDRDSLYLFDKEGNLAHYKTYGY